MANNVVHFEIGVDDIDRAKKFYEDVLGWAFQDLGEQYGGYTFVFPDGKVTDGPAEVGINGGMMKRQGPAPAGGLSEANSFVCTVATDDVDSVVQKALAAGGKVQMETADIPKVGRLAYLFDTEGNMFGVLKPVEGGAGM